MLSKREALVENLIRQGILKDDNNIEAFRKVPRELFLPKSLESQAYLDHPLPIGFGQTISAPHMVAIMNEELELKPRDKVLEVGSGSGYHAATIAEIVAPHGLKDRGHVYTVEMIPELANFAKKNLERTGYNNRVTVISGDGSEGYQDKAPYDKISVTAASPQVPHPLLSQLERGGLIVIPVGSVYSYQTLMIIRKDLEGGTTEESRGGCAFVPLKGKYGQ